MNYQLKHITPTIAARAKLFPGQGQSLKELSQKMAEIGNVVLEENEEGGYLLMMQSSVSDDRWGCLLCLRDSLITLLDTEQEFQAHLESAHPGWETEGELFDQA